MHIRELAGSAYFSRHQILSKAHQYPVGGKRKVRLLQHQYLLTGLTQISIVSLNEKQGYPKALPLP